MRADLGGYTDLHSHLVPGVDDGSPDLEDALASLARMRDLGILRIVITPHLDGSLTHQPGPLRIRLEQVDRAWADLKAAASAEFPELELYRGQEVMLDVPNPDLSDLRLHLAETRFVLVEWPSLSVPPGTLPALEGLRETGLKPIIAHPERYRGLEGDLDLAGEWRDAGALLQTNYGSLAGLYGEKPRRKAVTLIERGWVDLLSSDFHGRAHLSPGLVEARDFFLREGGEAQFDLLARVNTSRILEGEDPLPVPPLAVQKGFWRAFQATFRQTEKQDVP